MVIGEFGMWVVGSTSCLVARPSSGDSHKHGVIVKVLCTYLSRAGKVLSFTVTDTGCFALGVN